MPDCWSCGGEGYHYYCIDGCCIDAEEGCDLCATRCDVCGGKGGWDGPEEEDHG